MVALARGACVRYQIVARMKSQKRVYAFKRAFTHFKKNVYPLIKSLRHCESIPTCPAVLMDLMNVIDEVAITDRVRVGQMHLMVSSA